MNFKIAPDAMQKLSFLENATQFEPAGADPLSEQATSTHPQNRKELGVEKPGRRKPQDLPCISEVSTPRGKKPVLKAMMTTACERDCFYCPFRAGRSKTRRITFKADEMASTFDTMQRAGHVDGLFLSSGIIKGSVTTQDKIIDTAEILRKKYRYKGYVHLKIMPGAEQAQIHRALQIADRVSLNLEGPTESRLKDLAPKKDYWTELIQRLTWISEMRSAERLRASVVTQFVVGAVGDTDLELLSLSEKLYNQLGLKRTYYSAFSPIEQTPFENLSATPKARERRLYQSSFLLRDYGWSVEDLPFGGDTNLPLHIDPKVAWAEENLTYAPIEINRADRQQLLRIPGIGPKSADAILATRSTHSFTELSHLSRIGVKNIERTTPYILLNGKAPHQQLSLF